jgi:hypothetical protein
VVTIPRAVFQHKACEDHLQLASLVRCKPDSTYCPVLALFYFILLYYIIYVFTNVINTLYQVLKMQS